MYIMKARKKMTKIVTQIQYLFPTQKSTSQIMHQNLQVEKDGQINNDTGIVFCIAFHLLHKPGEFYFKYSTQQRKQIKFKIYS